MKNDGYFSQLNQIGFCWNPALMQELNNYSDQIAWSTQTSDVLQGVIIEKRSNLTIFPIELDLLNTYYEMNLLRPIPQKLTNQLLQDYWKPGLELFKKEGRFYGLPDDISFYGIVVPEDDLNTSKKWDWDVLRELILKYKKESGLAYWSGGMSNNLGFLYSVLGAFGININEPLSKSIHAKEAWLAAYEWLSSIELNWSNFFKDRTPLIELSAYSTKPKLEMGWIKQPANPFKNYAKHHFLKFPDNPIAKTRYDLCMGSCWTSIKNNIPDQTISDLFRIIFDIKNIKKMELESNSYFNMNTSIWKDKTILKKKPLYHHVDFFRNSENLLYLNLNTKHYYDIRSVFHKSLMHESNKNTFFAKLEELVSSGMSFYKENNLQRAITYIKNNYNEISKVKDITSYLDCSERHIQDLFNKKMNCTCWEYLLKVRVDIAMNELSYTSQSLQAISNKIGFKNAITFTRVFKKITGFTPSIYRKTNRIKKWDDT